jgi:hypothetical protein
MSRIRHHTLSRNFRLFFSFLPLSRGVQEHEESECETIDIAKSAFITHHAETQVGK